MALLGANSLLVLTVVVYWNAYHRTRIRRRSEGSKEVACFQLVDWSNFTFTIVCNLQFRINLVVHWHMNWVLEWWPPDQDSTTKLFHKTVQVLYIPKRCTSHATGNLQCHGSSFFEQIIQSQLKIDGCQVITGKSETDGLPPRRFANKAPTAVQTIVIKRERKQLRY